MATIDVTVTSPAAVPVTRRMLLTAAPVLCAARCTSCVADVMNTASCMSLVPLTLRRFGIDPAIATGPFVTTGMDGVGVTIYLTIATLLLTLW